MIMTSATRNNYNAHIKSGTGAWDCNLCEMDISNCPWGEYLYCRGVFTFFGNVFVTALYFMTIAVCAQQPLSNHKSAHCSKLIVEGLEWFRYLLSLGFGFWAILTSVLCMVYRVFGPKYNRYGTADVMLYYTPLLSGTSLLISVFVVCYYAAWLCASQIEAVTCEIDIFDFQFLKFPHVAQLRYDIAKKRFRSGPS